MVQVEVVKDFAEESWVTASEFEYALSNFTEEVGYGLLSDLSVLLFGNLPDGFHHADEVFVGGGAHGQVGVVVSELVVGYNSVFVALGTFKVGEEFTEDFFSGLASLKEFRVHGYVVDSNNIVDTDLSGAIFVEHGKGLVNHNFSSRGELVSINTFC